MTWLWMTWNAWYVSFSGKPPSRKPREHRVRVAQARAAERLPRHPVVRRPRMLEEHLVRRDHPLAHGRLPVGVVGSEIDLGRDEVDDAVDDVVLVATWL